jgi:L-ascorbate metabolism protein UlaG (beta-lactamase superfamily)
MEIKWLGTAAISYKHNDKTIIFDPYGGINKKLGCYSARELATYGDIFITHGHFDHLADVPAIMAQNKAKVYCAYLAAQSLINLGVDQSRIAVIAPGRKIIMGPFNIRVFKGKHIDFDRKLILETLLNLRVLRYFRNFLKVLSMAKKFPEGQTLIYEIEVDGKKIMHMGSLALAEGENYPQNVDLLVLPFQGRSDLSTYALPFVAGIKPKAIYFHHFDDAFPPFSNTISPDKFVQNVRNDFPDIKFIVPSRGSGINI